MSRRRILPAALGASLVAAGALLVGRAIARDWQDVAEALDRSDPAWLVAALLLAAGGMTGIGLAWREALVMVGTRCTRFDALTWFFTGELAKYVPGGPWGVVGRGETAARGGVARSMAYAAVLLSMLATCIAGMLVAVGFLLLRGGVGGWALDRAWPALAFPVGLLAVHPAVMSWIVGILRRWTGRPFPMEIPTWRTSMWLVAVNVPAWLSIGLATWCVTRALGAAPPVTEILFAAPASWVAGLLVLPAPGGLGVREAAFTMTATSLSAGVAATAALVARVLFMTVDALAAAAFGIWRWWTRGAGAVPSRGSLDGDG